VEKLNNRICTINKNRTTIMTSHLDRMAAILDRVMERANAAKAKGKDIATVEAAVATARGKIAEARTAVQAQSQKECVMSISGADTTIGSEVRNAISEYAAQLKEVRAKVIAARQAVSQAIRALAAVMGEKISVELKEGE
jgi:ribosome-associated translation inhibitor RaiA